MAELFLIRHGQASFGSDDYDQLSDIGVKQSQLLGQHFDSLGQSFDLCVTGSMKRHHQTADGILKFAKLDGERLEHKGWNEFDFESVIKAYLTQNPSETPATSAPRAVYYRLLKSAMYDWSTGKLTQGLPETWDAFTGRVDDARQAILNADCKRVLVATSGGAIAIKLMLLLGVSAGQAIDFNLQIKNTSVNHFFFSKKGFQLSTFNGISHLESEQRKHLITYS
jgi:broad specificity phosphatase PhoE